jgi:hypothetical protein
LTPAPAVVNDCRRTATSTIARRLLTVTIPGDTAIPMSIYFKSSIYETIIASFQELDNVHVFCGFADMDCSLYRAGV